MRITGALAFAVVGVLLAVTQPLSDLGSLGHQVLMALLIGVGLWMFQPAKLPLGLSTCLMMAVLLGVGIEEKLVFAGFVSSAIWILIPATAFGYVLTKTGLGKRIALLVLKSFEPTYRNMTLAWLIIGLILSAFTPSILIRIAIVMPIAVGCTSTLGLRPGSRGNAYILLIAWAMAIVPGSGWLTGSLWGPIMMGMGASVPGLAEVAGASGIWLRAMAPPMFVLTVLILAGLYVVLQPEKLSGLSRNAFANTYKDLGPWTRHEKVSCVILALAFAMFFLERLHGLSAVVVCLGAFFAFYALQVLEAEDLAKGVAWNLIIFLGGVLSLPAIFKSQDVGISAWINTTVLPLIEWFGHSPWLFVLLAPFFLFAWRFLDIAWMIPTMAILISLLPTIQEKVGVHPLVSACLMIMAGNFAFMAYMQPFAFMGSALSGERSWKSGQLMKYGVVYLVSCVATLALGMIYWQAIGLVK